ncbi:MAG: SdpI family protein [Clostridia bacterium]|nr:SdpI family protein [Clostridia bacterium]
MWFWYFMLVCDLLIPALMLVGGYLMWKHPPKKINTVFGYRTARSMKNMDTWLFAHHDCGKRWWLVGWILLIPSAVVQLPLFGKSETAIAVAGLILLVVQTTVMLLSLIPTERALARRFPEA